MGEHSDPKPENSHLSEVYTISAVAAISLDALLLYGIISLISSLLQPGKSDSLLLPLENNWLIVLFKINLRFPEIDFSALDINFLDVTLMVLACAVFVGLHHRLRRIHPVWAIFALALPILGLLIFLITGMAGRLGIHAGILVASFMLLGSEDDKSLAIIGFLAGILTIVGDGFTETTASPFNAGLIAAGYVFTIIWLYVIGRGLFKVGRDSS